MQHECRITVLETKVFSELQEKYLAEKQRNCKIEEKRNAQFLAYRELCIFVNKYF